MNTDTASNNDENKPPNVDKKPSLNKPVVILKQLVFIDISNVECIDLCSDNESSSVHNSRSQHSQDQESIYTQAQRSSSGGQQRSVLKQKNLGHKANNSQFIGQNRCIARWKDPLNTTVVFLEKKDEKQKYQSNKSIPSYSRNQLSFTKSILRPRNKSKHSHSQAGTARNSRKEEKQPCIPARTPAEVLKHFKPGQFIRNGCPIIGCPHIEKDIMKMRTHLEKKHNLNDIWIILDKKADPGIDVRAVLRNIRAMRAACFQAKNLHPTTTALPQRKSRQVPSNAISKRRVCSAALGVAPQEVAADD